MSTSLRIVEAWQRKLTCSDECAISVAQLVHEEMVLRVSDLPGMPYLRGSCTYGTRKAVETMEEESVIENACEQGGEIDDNDMDLGLDCQRRSLMNVQLQKVQDWEQNNKEAAIHWSQHMVFTVNEVRPVGEKSKDGCPQDMSLGQLHGGCRLREQDCRLEIRKRKETTA
tara:strand:+ start:63 stop:572 length:510 start_codon:yes stop_codon:yes gene_type:complete